MVPGHHGLWFLKGVLKPSNEEAGVEPWVPGGATRLAQGWTGTLVVVRLPDGLVNCLVVLPFRVL